MAQAFVALSAWQVMLAGLLFFGGIYLLFGAATWLLTQRILPALGIGRPLDPRPLAPGQLRREFTQSGVSILLFGTGMIFPWGLLQLGWAHLDPDASWQKITLEILALVAWNDVHFWINHRLLHTAAAPFPPAAPPFGGDHPVLDLQLPSDRGADAGQRHHAADGAA